jgi:hypothetical protein
MFKAAFPASALMKNFRHTAVDMNGVVWVSGKDLSLKDAKLI